MPRSAYTRRKLAGAQLAGTRKAILAHLTTVPLLIVDDLRMRKLPATAAQPDHQAWETVRLSTGYRGNVEMLPLDEK